MVGHPAVRAVEHLGQLLGYALDGKTPEDQMAELERDLEHQTRVVVEEVRQLLTNRKYATTRRS